MWSSITNLSRHHLQLPEARTLRPFASILGWNVIKPEEWRCTYLRISAMCQSYFSTQPCRVLVSATSGCCISQWIPPGEAPVRAGVRTLQKHAMACGCNRKHGKAVLDAMSRVDTKNIKANAGCVRARQLLSTASVPSNMILTPWPANAIHSRCLTQTGALEYMRVYDLMYACGSNLWVLSDVRRWSWKLNIRQRAPAWSPYSSVWIYIWCFCHRV